MTNTAGQEGQANPTDETKESSERNLGHGHGRELAAGAIGCCDVLEIEARMVKKDGAISQDRFEGFAVGLTEHEGTVGQPDKLLPPPLPPSTSFLRPFNSSPTPPLLLLSCSSPLLPKANGYQFIYLLTN